MLDLESDQHFGVNTSTPAHSAIGSLIFISVQNPGFTPHSRKGFKKHNLATVAAAAEVSLCREMMGRP